MSDETKNDPADSLADDGTGAELERLVSARNEVGDLLSRGALPAPFAQQIVLIERTWLAGSRALPRVSKLAVVLTAEQELTLRRDVGNANNEYAIDVFTAGGDKLGQLRASESGIIARLMDAGKHVFARVLNVERGAAGPRIFVEVVLDD